jgi:hypothetical protein
MVIINTISIEKSMLKIEYKGESPGPPATGICSKYTDGYCGGFKSCQEQTEKACEYNINFTKGYGTVTTYDTYGHAGGCGFILPDNCDNDTDVNIFVPVAVPLAWFNKIAYGNCEKGLSCSSDSVIDNNGNKLCFKLTNIDDPTKYTNVIVQDKCGGNCPGTNCSAKCTPSGCKTPNDCSRRDRAGKIIVCLDPAERCAIYQRCTKSPAITSITNADLVIENNPSDLNEQYGISACCPTDSITYGDWCSGFYAHFDIYCGAPIVAQKKIKYTNLCRNASQGENCAVMYERIECPK